MEEGSGFYVPLSRHGARTVIAAAFGDIVGSVYEHRPVKTTDFPLLTEQSRYTDDTLCTSAIAEALRADGDFAGALRRFVARYLNRLHGTMFDRWARDESNGPCGGAKAAGARLLAFLKDRSWMEAKNR